MNLRILDLGRFWFPVVVGVALVAGMVTGLASANNFLDSSHTHWGRGSLTKAAWRVEDFTSDRWPVFTAQIDWDRSRALASNYVEGGTCVRERLSRCVPARERRLPPSHPCGPAFGCFVYTATTRAGHFAGGRRSHYILYNNSTTDRFSFNQRWALTCQEQGHAAGLGHRHTRRSCMFQDSSKTPSHHPDRHDFFMLRRIYGH